MDNALVGGYQQPSPITTTLVRFDTPGGPICLTDGGFTQFDANEGNGPEIYYGNHPTYGRLSTISSIKDGAEAQTTRVDITILPASDVAAAALAAPSMQGVRVQWWEGVIHRQDGLLIGYPELKFDGEIDKPRFRVGGSRSLVQITLIAGHCPPAFNPKAHCLTSLHRAAPAWVLWAPPRRVQPHCQGFRPLYLPYRMCQ